MSDNTLFFDCAKAIIDRLNANWTALPVVLDNDDGSGLDLADGFVQVTVQYQDSGIATINGANPKIRTTGVIIFDIFTPQNKGIGLGHNYAGQIGTVFRGQSFSGVVCFAPAIASGRQIDYSVGKYWLTPLLCPFHQDQHVTIS